MLFARGHCYLYGDADAVAGDTQVAKADVVRTLTPDGQYEVRWNQRHKKPMTASAPVSGTAIFWHRRICHLSYDNLEKVSKMVTGMPTKEVIPKRVAGAVCRPRVEGKMVIAPFPASDTRTELMQLLHVDVTGPFTTSIGVSRQLFTMYEDKTGMLVGVPIPAKSNAGKIPPSRIPELAR